MVHLFNKNTGNQSERSYTSNFESKCIMMLAPDLNPIKNLWYHTGKPIKKHRPRIFSLNQLEAAIHEEWKKLEDELFSKLALSMPERCGAVRKSRGGHTKY
jgi:hypothetical protein